MEHARKSATGKIYRWQKYNDKVSAGMNNGRKQKAGDNRDDGDDDDDDE